MWIHLRSTRTWAVGWARTSDLSRSWGAWVKYLNPSKPALFFSVPLYLCPVYRQEPSVCCFNVMCPQSLMQTKHERDSWLLLFRNVVIMQPLACSNLAVQVVLTKICSEWDEHLEYLTGEDSERLRAEAQADKTRYIISKTEIGFIILDVMLYNGCPSDIELVCIEQIQLLTWHICSPLGIFVWLCCKDVAIWSCLQGAPVRTQFKNAGCGKETDTWGWNDPVPGVLRVFQQFLNIFFFWQFLQTTIHFNQVLDWQMSPALLSKRYQGKWRPVAFVSKSRGAER